MKKQQLSQKELDKHRKTKKETNKNMFCIYDFEGTIQNIVDDLLGWCEGLLFQEGYDKSVEPWLELDYVQESDHPHIVACYQRFETDAEVLLRLREEEREKEKKKKADKKSKEQRKKQYEKLKKEFGDE